VAEATVNVPDQDFVAIDFETADYEPDSACAVALVHCVGDRVVDRVSRLIRPPRKTFVFTYLHGIAWEHVRDQPPFGAVWSELASFASRGSFLAAHNASFDRNALRACCRMSGVAFPAIPFLCTVDLSRRTWRLPSHRLDVVCRHLGIPLNHHDASSDAEACARIVIEARRARSVGT
jgi:DNA polymerase-3 subunit epsilon